MNSMSQVNSAARSLPAHIPSLDGLRAVAVLIVFIGHGMAATAVWPGHVGVTIFFFLSGYLIVTLLRREYEKTGRIALRKFYIRRALRILPPTYLAVGAAVALAAIGVLHGPITGAGVASEVLHFTNYYIVAAGREGLPPATTQLWSLSVEEHYYLAIPAALIGILLWGRSMKRAGWILLTAGLVVSAWRIFLGLNGASFDRLYVSTDTRMDSLLFGSAFALLLNPATSDALPWASTVERHVHSWLAAFAALVFVGSAVIPSLHFRFSVADAVQCACLVPIFWTLIRRPDGLAGRVLNSKFIRHIGVLSFSVYLFHRMVLDVVEQVITYSVLSDAVSLALTLCVAEVVYRLVERPLASVRKRLGASAAVKVSA